MYFCHKALGKWNICIFRNVLLGNLLNQKWAFFGFKKLRSPHQSKYILIYIYSSSANILLFYTCTLFGSFNKQNWIFKQSIFHMFTFENFRLSITSSVYTITCVIMCFSCLFVSLTNLWSTEQNHFSKHWIEHTMQQGQHETLSGIRRGSGQQK